MHWTDRLSDYLDGELSPEEALALELHLESCAPCAAALDEIRAVVAAAAALPEHPPTRDLWPGIEARLTPRTTEGLTADVVSLDAFRARGRRVSVTVPQLIAAGLALVVLSAGGVWLAVGSDARAVAGMPPEAAEATAPVQSPFTYTAAWEEAVTELQGEFDLRRSELDPATIMVVERNLALIDEAIAEARQALEADPSSGFLNGYVAEAMRRKVDLLRQATRVQRTET
ncbi:MAG: zf-HC2 domain-containing protein [Gemmatimonadetes bacterium]|nr:zf-HC2 domain-containing protein [Gemmatimonadota bacterium]